MQCLNQTFVLTNKNFLSSCLVYGMVWYGVVCGVDGMVWYGTVRYSVAWHGVAWFYVTSTIVINLIFKSSDNISDGSSLWSSCKDFFNDMKS